MTNSGRGHRSWLGLARIVTRSVWPCSSIFSIESGLFSSLVDAEQQDCPGGRRASSAMLLLVAGARGRQTLRLPQRPSWRVCLVVEQATSALAVLSAPTTGVRSILSVRHAPCLCRQPCTQQREFLLPQALPTRPRSVLLCVRLCSESRDLKFWQKHLSLWLSRKRYASYGGSYNGRLIENRMWPIDWHQYQWPWMTLKVIRLLQACTSAVGAGWPSRLVWDWYTTARLAWRWLREAATSTTWCGDVTRNFDVVASCNSPHAAAFAAIAPATQQVVEVIWH